MVNLRKWSTTATGNASVSGGINTINFAEGQTPGSVNNSAREMMAQLRGVYTPSEWGWVEHSGTASVASQTTFKLPGNTTTDWTAGRRWRLKSGSTTRYGSVVSSSYTVETTVTVTVDGGVSLSASHSLAALSPIDASSNQLPLAQQSFLRNRIINGDMRIDQRNAGAAVSIVGSGPTYSVDRWGGGGQAAAGVYTLQQSSTAPAGYKTSLLATVTTSSTPSGNQVYLVQQRIEGYNIADLGLGAAGAQSVTLSFWVRSSVTGTFGGSIGNGVDQSYPFSYTISAANTWEQKTVTIPGSTSGTWNTTTGVGLLVAFSLGAAGTSLGTANTWANYPYAPTGSTNLIATLSATWYITGVQLEAGSTATAFERRQYGQELALCQRYYETGEFFYVGYSVSTNIGSSVKFSVTKRATPTISQTNLSVGGGTSATVNSSGIKTDSFLSFRTVSGTGASQYNESWTASAEL